MKDHLIQIQMGPVNSNLERTVISNSTELLPLDFPLLLQSFIIGYFSRKMQDVSRCICLKSCPNSQYENVCDLCQCFLLKALNMFA